MERPLGEIVGGTIGNDLPEFHDDVPMSRFLATPREFYFPNKELHIDLTVREPIPLKLGSLVGGTGKADVVTVDCRDLGYRRHLVCKIMKTRKKTKYAMKPPELRGLRHVHVVAFVATFTHNHRDYALMYPHAKTDLGKYMEPVSNWLRGEEFYDSHVPIVSKVEDLDLSMSAPARISHLRNFFPCIAGALQYLHTQNVKHKDIKPANILVDRFNSPILADFDISHRYTDHKEAPTGGPTIFTYSYAAPEAIGNEDRPYESDIFSLACVFSEMITLVMGQNLQDFECSRARGPQGDAAFHKSIPATRAWLTKLYDQSSTDELRKANKHTLQFVPIEGYHQDQALITAINTICRMLDSTPHRRPIARGMSRFFCPIATNHCTECTEQRERDKSSLQTIREHDAALGLVQDSNAAILHEPSQSPAHLTVPLQSAMLSGRDRGSDCLKASVNGGQFANEQPPRPIEQSSAPVGRSSPHRKPSPASPERSPLPPNKPLASPERSPAPSYEQTNGLFDNPGTLSQRQKLRGAIGYDVQDRKWKIRFSSELESEADTPIVFLDPSLTIFCRARRDLGHYQAVPNKSEARGADRRNYCEGSPGRSSCSSLPEMLLW